MHGTGIKIIDTAASIGSHETNMKYVSFPRPAVVATQDRKRLAQTLHSIRNYWLQNNYSYAQHSVISIPFKLCRRFPIRIAFGTKVNIAQGHDS